jgi:hypothetical protein
MAAGTGRRPAQERTVLAAALAVAVLLALGGMALPRLRTGEPAPEPAPRPMVDPADAQPPASPPPASEPVTERTVAIAPGSVRAFCKLRRRVAGTDRAPAYLGAFAIEDDDGGALLEGTSVNNDEVAFALPRRSKSVTVRAAGYRPATVAVAIASDAAGDTADFGEIALEPDAQLRFVVRGLPAAAIAKLRLTVTCGQESISWSGACDADGAATVAVPSGRALHWQLAAQGTGTAFQTGGDAPVLAREERREVLVDTAAIPAQRFRVEGVSRELLPHLSVRLLQNGAFVRIALDEEGRGCLRSEVAEDVLRLDLDGQDVALVASTGATALVSGAPSENVLHPAEAIVGVQLRAADGALVPFSLDPGARVFDRHQAVQAVRVRRAAELREAGRLTVWSEATGSLRFPPAAFDGPGDFVTLDARLGASLAVLQIAVGGERPRALCEVEVLRPDGAELCNASVLDTPPMAIVQGLDAGSYDLRWRVGREPGAWIARGVALAAGQRRELTASWPVRTLWHGEVAGWGDLPPGRRWHTVRFGSHSEPWLMRLALDRDGRFLLELPPDEAPPRAVEFFHALMHLPGEVVDVDAAKARIVVQPPRDVRWVELCVQADADWLAYVWRPTADPLRPEFWMPLRRSDQRPLLVPSGAVLNVVVHEVEMTGFGRVFGMVAIDGTQPRVVVRADAGHWIDVVGPPGASFALLDAAGADVDLHTLDAGGRARLWVPDGARGVRCWRERPDPPAPAPFTDRPVPAALLDLR